MAFTVKFYKNFNKKTNSTKQPANGDAFDTFTCVLKENCGVVAPVIDVYTSDNPAGKGYNYAYIDGFSRYYFVSDWKYNVGLWTVYLTVDVLASFKTAIGNLSKYVTRSASASNGDIIDTFYPAKSNVTEELRKGTNPFSLSNGCYILGLIGERPNANVPCVGGVNYYLLDTAEMIEFSNYLTSNTFVDLIKDTSAGLSAGISRAITNPIEYVSSCMFIPYNITGVDVDVQPKIGWYDTAPLTNPGCKAIGGGTIANMVKAVTISNITGLGNHPQYTRGAYLNREPYTRYELYFEPFGAIPLDGNLINPSLPLEMTISIDLITGFGRLTVYNNNQIVGNMCAQIGVPIQVSQIASDIIQGSINTATALWNTVKNAFTGGGVNAIMNGANGIVSALESFTPKASNTGINGSVLSYTGTQFSSSMNSIDAQGVYLKIYRLLLTDENQTEFGRPLCEVRTINTLSGYIETAEPDNDISCFNIEKQQISSYLTGGFYYE